MSTLIIVPAYNEEASLPDVLRELAEHAPGYDVLVVDDGSRDDTTGLARRDGAGVLTLPFNLGVGGALRAGFRYAVAHDYDRALQFDADGQHEPADIRALIEALDAGADLVIGSRFVVPNPDYEVSGTRWLAMRLLRGIVKLLSGRRFTDTTSGFRGFSRPVIEMYAREMSVEYMADTVEALLRALYARYVVVEVPIRMRVRTAGRPSHRHVMLAYQFSRLLVVIMTSASLRHRRKTAS